jgi:hypothetical protein
MSGWLHSGPIPSIWPPDRFEVRTLRTPPGAGAIDRYAYAATTHEAVNRLRDAGLVTQIQVIRLNDRALLFDLVEGVSAPVEEW